jgi:hypothetical protein
MIIFPEQSTSEKTDSTWTFYNYYDNGNTVYQRAKAVRAWVALE